MAKAPLADPYHLDPAHIENPPRSFGATFRRIGPGLILAGSIVGSGELIATTVLGAENGYTLLWLILVSCVIKTVVQNELGRYSIGTGQTTLEALNRVPGATCEGRLGSLALARDGDSDADANRGHVGRHLRNPS